MRLISLNTWGGKVFESLIEFIKKESKDTDIFCFQEIYDTSSDIKNYSPSARKTEIARIESHYKDSIRANLLDELKNILKDFRAFYFPTLKGHDDVPNPVDFDLTYGQAIFIKSSIKIVSKNNYFISGEDITKYPGAKFADLPTPLQHISFESAEKTFHIFNFHGTPFPGDKKDSPLRLEEANKVKKIMGNFNGAKILVGDFNLLPETESIKIHEQNLVNLIKKFNIERTRSNLSPYFGTSNFQKDSDFTFISNDVIIHSFEVRYIEISDHLPMILEFS